MRNIKACYKHGPQLFTEPAREDRPSYCIRCVAEQVKKRPNHFFLTNAFKKKLEREGLQVVEWSNK